MKRTIKIHKTFQQCQHVVKTTASDNN